ncbi:MAG: winged helix-turn-helix transcriptional regulator, partial [Spirochaetia bacterium]|nr:winged helix-turn-helix transcriptional regulator [Spirochaetia bacterium]
MYQTPFKIKAEAIQLISDIAELQAICGGKGEKCASYRSLLREYLPEKFRQGYGTGRLPFLMQDLLGWLDKAPDHILIKGCELLYELETNQPFDEDNGEIGRRCLLSLLGTWNPVFQSLPLEEEVAASQSQYRYALRAAGDAGDSGVFITFMLHLILAALEKCKVAGAAKPEARVKGSISVACDPINAPAKDGDLINDLLNVLAKNPGATYDDLAAQLGVSPATIKRRLTALKTVDTISRVGSKKAGTW